jgi:hypothetical protein
LCTGRTSGASGADEERGDQCGAVGEEEGEGVVGVDGDVHDAPGAAGSGAERGLEGRDLVRKDDEVGLERHAVDRDRARFEFRREDGKQLEQVLSADVTVVIAVRIVGVVDGDGTGRGWVRLCPNCGRVLNYSKKDYRKTQKKAHRWGGELIWFTKSTQTTPTPNPNSN